MRRIIRIMAVLAVLVSMSYCSDSAPPARDSKKSPTAASTKPVQEEITRAEFDDLVKIVEKQERELVKLRSDFDKSLDGGFFGGGFILLLLAVMGYIVYRNWGKLSEKLETLQGMINLDGTGVPTGAGAGQTGGSGSPPSPPAPPKTAGPPQPVTSPNADGTATMTGTTAAASSPPQEAAPAQPSPVQDYQPRSQPTVNRSPTDDRRTSPPPNSEERLYAEQPANGIFLTTRIADVPDNFSAYSLTPLPGGQRGTFDLMDDPEVQQQVLNSKASYGQAIEFRGDGNYIAETTPGSLAKEDGGWRIIDRMVVHLQ